MHTAHRSRSPQRRPSFRSSAPPQKDRLTRIRSRSTSPLPPPSHISQSAFTELPTAPNNDNTTLGQPSTSRPTDTDRNLRQTKNRHRPRSSSPQRRARFRSATPPHEADRLTRIRSTLPLLPPPQISQAASTHAPPAVPNHVNIDIVVHSIGGMPKACQYYDAELWPTETSSLCCGNGQVNLPPLQTLPELLHQLFVGG